MNCSEASTNADRSNDLRPALAHRPAAFDQPSLGVMPRDQFRCFSATSANWLSRHRQCGHGVLVGARAAKRSVSRI